jgi:predicted RNase H-like HicB family nuclease
MEEATGLIGERPTMTHYPVLFSRRDRVRTERFTAGIFVAGRILVTSEDGEFWAEAVSPGGIAERGDSVSNALGALCKSYYEVLLDIAEGEDDFGSFKAAAERFFFDTNTTALRDWEEAVLQVRAGEVDLKDMGKRPSETQIGIQVVPLAHQTLAPKKPEVHEESLAA